MTQNEALQERLKFHRSLKHIFTGEAGEYVLKYLTQMYVDSSALEEKSERTHYRLGQKEFVQGIIRDINLDESELKVLLGDKK